MILVQFYKLIYSKMHFFILFKKVYFNDFYAQIKRRRLVYSRKSIQAHPICKNTIIHRIVTVYLPRKPSKALKQKLPYSKVTEMKRHKKNI